MHKILPAICVVVLFSSCNPTLTKFTFIYNDEGPNKAIMEKMEKLLEDTYYNTDIILIEGEGTNQNLDSLKLGTIDFALVENYINYIEGINSVFSVYSEVLHICYRGEEEMSNFKELVTNRSIYAGKIGSPVYNVMEDLLQYYSIDIDSVTLITDKAKADVIMDLTDLLIGQKLEAYEGYKLFSLAASDEVGNSSTVEGISLRYPRLTPFVIPKDLYGSLTEEPIVTLSVHLIMTVRSDLGEIPVSDLAKTILRNRQIFTAIDPLLYDGLKEDFNQSKLNIPLHEGARSFLARDEPSFIERYAELGGVILSLIIATWSGLVSLTKWQAQKKKDRIDEFYEDLIKTKNKIPKLTSRAQVIAQIKHIKAYQNKAFELLIGEELVANESFRIYMELSKETLNDLRIKLKSFQQMKEKLPS